LELKELKRMSSELVHKIIEIANDIYTSIGPGYNEVIYHRAFEVGLRTNGLGYQSEVIVPIFYKGHSIGNGRIDLFVENKIILELKAVNNLNNDCIVQIRNYMKYYSTPEGLVFNFNQRNGSLDIRYILQDTVFNFVNGSFVQA
jgi:GxxExxY protein